MSCSVTADDFQAEWLFPLPHTNIAQVGNLSLLDPNIGKRRAAKESKIHLPRVVDGIR